MGGLTPPRALNAGDDRNAFDCGRESLNYWFRRNAWRNQEDGTSRTNVIIDTVNMAVAGYVTLVASQIDRAHLPKPAQRNRPDPIPAILLGQLAVDQRYQGRGCARSLMLFALRTALRLSDEIGCYGVITHPLDEGVRAFYRDFGFQDLPFDPGRAMIIRIIDLKQNNPDRN
jgi:GNAT superfamily N-acetyltransferase